MWVQHFRTGRNQYFCLHVFFLPSREFFYTYGDVTIIGEGLQILTFIPGAERLAVELSLPVLTT